MDASPSTDAESTAAAAAAAAAGDDAGAYEVDGVSDAATPRTQRDTACWQAGDEGVAAAAAAAAAAAPARRQTRKDGAQRI